MMIRNLLLALLFLPNFILGQNTVVDIVVGSDDHNTLEAAVLAAGLETTLSSEGPFTLFAPTDGAFEALPQTLINDLLENPGGALTNILLQHVISGTILSTDLNDGDAVQSLFGEDLNVVINGDGVFIDGAKVTIADIPADNGVVHVIDAVIVPEGNFNTIMDIVTSSSDHNTLQTVLNLSGINETLNSNGSFTLFAPTDEAFSAIPQDIIDALLADPMGQLTEILLYHALGDAVESGSISDQQRVTTVNGKDVIFTINSDGVFINDAKITITDLPATNGFVHVIDAVIIPGNSAFDIVAGSPDHTILESAIRAVGLEDFLSTEDVTLFAPNDSAFNALPDGTIDFLIQNPNILTEILANHAIIDGYSSEDFNAIEEVPLYPTYAGYVLTINTENDTFTVNDIAVETADLIADNGYVNVIGSVIINPDSTVVDVVRGSAVHTVLDTLIETAGEEVIRILESYGPFTLFAPVDDAFAGFTQEEIETLLDDPETIIEILGDHLVFGQALSTDLMDGMELTTANENTLIVTINSEGVFVNNAQVILPDVTTDNGVVHVIDAVIAPSTTTVLDIIQGSPVHTTLAAAINLAGLEDALGSEGPFTVFAPTNDAFDALPDGLLDELLMDPQGALTDILLYHVAPVEAFSGDLSDGQMVMTLNGNEVLVTFDNEGVLINNARVTIADLPADNGVVHVIDAVLVPPTPSPVGLPLDFELPADSYSFVGFEGADSAIETNPDQSGVNTSATIMRTTKTQGAQFFAGTLIDLDETIDLTTNTVINIDTWSPKADIPVRIALESNGGGNQIFVDVNTTVANEWETLSADFTGLIDPNVDYGRVVVFFEFIVNLPGDGTTYYFDNIEVAPLPSVVDIIVGSDVHNTLEAAVIAADLVETLQGEGPFTVFAPTDDAFANLPAGVLDVLLADPQGALTDILLYHVAQGNVTSDQLSDGQEIVTVNGNTVTVTIDNGMVMINDAVVTIADIRASNGVVHVIDAVLLPPTNTVLDIIQGSSIHTTLATAINLAGLESTLEGEGPFTIFAPTDAAFEALPDGLLDELLMDPEGALRNVLLYHVVAGTRLASSLNDGESITTVLGQDVNVSISNEGVFINTAQVIVTDLEGDNGVVHVIDAVLTPTTSTKDQVVEKAELFPNPVKDMLQYNIESLTKGLLTITVYDNQGRIVNRLNNNPALGSLDVSLLPNGVYTVVFENNEVVAQNRIMKM